MAESREAILGRLRDKIAAGLRSSGAVPARASVPSARRRAGSI